MNIIKAAKTEQFILALNNKIDELESGVKESKKVTSSNDLIACGNCGKINKRKFTKQPVTASKVPSWVSKYYSVISDEDFANEAGCDVAEVDDYIVDNIESYDAKHVAWMKVKPEYAKQLRDFDVVEIVSEGGEVFPADISSGRIYNIEDEIKEYVGEEIEGGAGLEIAKVVAPVVVDKLADAVFNDDTNSCDKVMSDDEVKEETSESNDNYIQTLETKLREALASTDDSDMIFELQDMSAFLTLTVNGEVMEVQIPFEDISFDMNTVDQDVAKIVEAITGSEPEEEVPEGDEYIEDDVYNEGLMEDVPTL